MRTVHPSCIHILRRSLKRSVKRTWTSSAFSTNESAWSVMVTGSQSRVWSGPNFHKSTLINPLNVSLSLMNDMKTSPNSFQVIVCPSVKKNNFGRQQVITIYYHVKIYIHIVHISKCCVCESPKSSSKSVLGLRTQGKEVYKNYIEVMFHLVYIIESIFHRTH
jgi:hypothetical protein